MNKKNRIYKIILIITAIILIYVTYCSIFNIDNAEQDMKPIVLIIGTITCILFFINIKKYIEKISEKKLNIFFIILCICFFIALNILGSKFIPVQLYKDNVSYILRYENLGHFSIIINASFIIITFIFVYLSIKELTNYKDALIAIIFFAINPILYIYVAHPCSQILCMLLFTGTIYLFIKATKQKHKQVKILTFILSGILFISAYIILINIFHNIDISFNKYKFSRAWSNGQYNYISDFTNVEKMNILYEYILGTKRIFIGYYCQIMKSTILVVSIGAILSQIMNKNRKVNPVYLIMFIGLAYCVICSVSNSYSLAYLPVMIIVFSEGIKYIEKILQIKQCKCEFNKENTKIIDIDVINRWIISTIFICTIFLLFINFFEYSVDEEIFWNKRVMQLAETGKKEKKISNRVIQQTFKTSKSFDVISIKFKKGKSVQNQEMTNYIFELHNKNNELLYKEIFTSKDVEDGQYKTFSFKEVEPTKNEKYTIKIYSTDATDENTIKLAVYSSKDYRAYKQGKLMIDNKSSKADLVFRVEDKVKRTYVSKTFYIMLALLIIEIQFFAFYPYINKKGEKYGKDRV